MASLAATLISEFVGTFLLVLTIGTNVATNDGPFVVFSIALVLMVFVYALGGVSGACLNPAVALAVFVSGGLEAVTFAACVVTQLVAGFLGALGATLLTAGKVSMDPVGLAADVAIVEFLYTLMLCFVVLNVAVEKRATPNEYFGLAIGFVVVAGGYGGGAISGGQFNPAVSLAVAHWGGGFISMLFVWASQILGSLAAFGLYKAVTFQENGLQSKLLAEFLGTFYLVFTVLLNVAAGPKAAVLSIAASLTSMIYALGYVSGANFNPAVSFALVLRRGQCIGVGLDWKTALAYAGVQLIGGLVAAGIAMAAGVRIGGLPDEPIYLAGGAELVFTFVLCFVVLSVATTKVSNVMKTQFGLAIGSCVTAGGYAIGAISGGCLNPAVATGVVALSRGSVVTLALYFVFQLLGAALAFGVFRATRPEEFGAAAKADGGQPDMDPLVEAA